MEIYAHNKSIQFGTPVLYEETLPNLFINLHFFVQQEYNSWQNSGIPRPHGACGRFIRTPPPPTTKFFLARDGVGWRCRGFLQEAVKSIFEPINSLTSK